MRRPDVDDRILIRYADISMLKLPDETETENLHHGDVHHHHYRIHAHHHRPRITVGVVKAKVFHRS